VCSRFAVEESETRKYLKREYNKKRDSFIHVHIRLSLCLDRMKSNGSNLNEKRKEMSTWNNINNIQKETIKKDFISSPRFFCKTIRILRCYFSLDWLAAGWVERWTLCS
jgi:hypothetical protein